MTFRHVRTARDRLLMHVSRAHSAHDYLVSMCHMHVYAFGGLCMYGYMHLAAVAVAGIPFPCIHENTVIYLGHEIQSLCTTL